MTEHQVGVAITAVVMSGMEYFAPNRRMSADHVTMFSEEIMQQFPHESVADVALFMRGAAMGRYGEEGKEGETYGPLDIPRLGTWFRQYLGEKADARERIERKASKDKTNAALNGLANIPRLKGSLNRIIANRNAERSETVNLSRLLKLIDHLPLMSDDELRLAWGVHGGGKERDLIRIEATKRGLIGKEFINDGYTPAA